MVVGEEVIGISLGLIDEVVSRRYSRCYNEHEE